MIQNQTITEPLIKEVVLDASISRVWKAITSKDDLSKWSFEMKEFKPEVGFEFQFYGEKDGHKFLHLCKVVEVVKEKKIKWLWTYKDVKGDTFVTFELFPEGEKTRLRLTHEGLENLPQDENYAKHNFEAGWNSLLNSSLKNYLKKENKE
jgi:uncharacterized protein YndB with AHSA1/START domain